MRKLHQVALVVAAASGLSAIGVGPSVADAPVGYGGTAPAPAPRQDAQAATWTRSQTSVQTSNAPTPHREPAAPQRGAEVSPQLNPQLSPQLNPQISPQPASQEAPLHNSNLFRPYQECSPQSLLNAAVPVAVLAAAENRGIDCHQANSQANAVSSARSVS
ncbi:MULTISPECIES: hypothetical protein [unclassified Streptomyces]|uniref:hypothetical protein n=1 Tax=unclassified Streptomyces TaxID=2593676 RepID=UPI0023658B82|nr:MULTISPECIES: hypothetical protein [unclassified Streptomyces]MDF3146366.1 hypothetical protein [Streptomyces sp. T21Q-yed]WDF39208.1 hypothetical protein PBV52_21590 [Streptomyces sp. T12]